jgi:hypothetical protein
MLKLFQFLWSGCWHQWGSSVSIGKVDIYDYRTDFKEKNGFYTTYERFQQHCSKCNKYRSYQVRSL